ncbi:MAG: hypothetical protein R2774_09530 [Saprospiraceae bacterium]
MKNLILIALAISILQVVNAQEAEIGNKVILGGSINFLTQNNTYPLSGTFIITGLRGIYSNNTNNTRNTTFTISPYIGKEINPNLIVGLQFDYGIDRYKAEDVYIFGQPDSVDIKNNSNQIGFGIFTRHILNPDGKFNFYIQPYLEYNLLSEEDIQDANVIQERKANYLEVGVGLGMLYNINSKIRATLKTGGINYVNGSWEIKNTDTSKKFSSFGTNLNLSTIYFGLEIRI